MNDVSGAVFCDLFAGSGAMGIEALSRGASKCILCDSDRVSVRLIRTNLVMIPFLFLLRMGVVFLNDLDLLDWHYSCIYLISAFPWFLLGNLISSVQNRIKVSDSVLLLTSAAGIMLEVLLVFLKLSSVLSEAVTIILTTALFVIAVRHPGFSLGRVIERIGHSYSVFVYIFHVLIAGVITVAAVKTNVANEEWVWWSRPFITIMICLLIGRLTKRNSKRAVS